MASVLSGDALRSYQRMVANAPVKRTVEVSVPQPTGQAQTLRLTVNYEKHDEQPYTHILTLSASLPTPSSSTVPPGVDDPTIPIVTAETVIVRKNACRRGEFHGIMDIHSHDTSTLATTLFDMNGHLRKKFVREGSLSRGTGVWGHELDRGTFIIIERIDVQKAHRGKGYAKWILGQILAQPEVTSADAEKGCSFAYAWPFATPERTGSEGAKDQASMTAAITHVLASVGFRRVGRTAFLACALRDPNHPSRTLAMENDATQPDLAEGLLIDPTSGVEEEDFSDILAPIPRKPETASEVNNALAAQFPVHHAIANQDGEELLASIIRFLAEDATVLRRRDVSGATPLHIAALMTKVTAVKTLLGTDAKNDIATKDNEGRTPLEALDEQLDSEQELLRMMTIPFSGHSAAAVETKALLRGALDLPAIQAAGCTCGQCLFGFLSRRMYERLLSSAEIAGDMVPDSLDTSSSMNRQPLDPEIVEMVWLSGFIPRHIRIQPVYKSFILGYGLCFTAAASLLRRKSLPTVQAVEQELRGSFYDGRYVAHYFSHGGTVEHALDALVSRTRQATGEPDEAESLPEDFEKLPKCANDEDFVSVHRHLGLNGRIGVEDSGFFDEDDGLDEDYDSEDDEMEF